MKVGIVDTEDISIVIQGLTVKNADYFSYGWTNECVRRLRKIFPDAETLSTWKGAKINGLEADLVALNDGLRS